MMSYMKLGLGKSRVSRSLWKGIQSRGLHASSRIILSRRLLSSTARRCNKIDTKAEYDILVAQRGNRPISPHLTIYQPQLTWYLSSLHRITCILLGAVFYVVTIGFGLSSLFGLGVSTEKLSNWYHDKFQGAESAIRAAFAYVFALQFGLSIRHFMWDMGKQLTLKGVYSSGYAMMGLAAVLGTYLWW